MRKLSGKTINSLALCVALAAPLVYLFGALFMQLAGSHGTQMLAGEYTTTQPSETIVIEGIDYKRAIYSDTKYTINYTTSASMVWRINNNLTVQGNYNTSNLPNTEETGEVYLEARYTEGSVKWYPTNTTQSLYAFSWFSTNRYYWENYGNTTIRYDTISQTVTYNNGFGTTENMTIDFSNYPISANETQLQWLESVRKIPQMQPRETKDVSESPKGNSDYIFGQFFASNNWLAESGREVLNGTPLYGFEPIGELVRYTDTNMLHLANLSYGPLVIGYTYYCAHVIIVDLIFYIGSFIPRLIKKTINKLEGGLD